MTSRGLTLDDLRLVRAVVAAGTLTGAARQLRIRMEVSLWLLVHPSLRRVARVRVILDALATALARLRRLIDGRGAQ